jgi:hypothetical protein
LARTFANKKSTQTMIQKNSRSLAIACASGSFKGAFVHGVLNAFEGVGLKADAYAASSSSVLPAAWAAIGTTSDPGAFYWQAGLKLLQEPDKGMSDVVRCGIERFSSSICDRLFEPDRPNFFVAASAVVSMEAAEQTQGKQARKLGRRLLVSASKKDRSWTDRNLQPVLFGNVKGNLHANNFDEVAYASCRMLHAWDIPAWIDGKPYIDASYTCMCPAIEMVEQGYQEIIAIATEPGTLYRDIFGLEAIRDRHKDIPIAIVKPDIDSKELGVDFTKATEEGLLLMYRHGEEKGRAFIDEYDKNR